MKCLRKKSFGFWLSVLSVTISTSKAPFLTPNLADVLVSVSHARNGNGNGNKMADNPLGDDPDTLSDDDLNAFVSDGGNTFATAPETPALTSHDILAGNTGGFVPGFDSTNNGQADLGGSGGAIGSAYNNNAFTPAQTAQYQQENASAFNNSGSGFSLTGFLNNAGSALGIAAVTAAKVAPLFGVQQSEEVAQQQAAAQPVNNTWIYIGVAAIVVILIIQKENG